MVHYISVSCLSFYHLRTETEPVSETLWFYFKNWDDGKCPDKQDTEMMHL
jgi:hypothetical protein